MSAEPNKQPAPPTSAADVAAGPRSPATDGPSAPSTPTQPEPSNAPAAASPVPAGPSTAADLVARWATPDPGPTRAGDGAKPSRPVAAPGLGLGLVKPDLPGSASVPAAPVDPAWPVPEGQPATGRPPVAGAETEVAQVVPTGAGPTGSGQASPPNATGWPAGGPTPLAPGAGPRRPAPLAETTPRRLVLAGLSVGNILVFAMVGALLGAFRWGLRRGTARRRRPADGREPAEGHPARGGGRVDRHTRADRSVPEPGPDEIRRRRGRNHAAGGGAGRQVQHRPGQRRPGRVQAVARRPAGQPDARG